MPSIGQGLLPGRRLKIAYTAAFGIRGKSQVRAIKQFDMMLETIDFGLEVYSQPETNRTYGARGLLMRKRVLFQKFIQLYWLLQFPACIDRFDADLKKKKILKPITGVL